MRKIIKTVKGTAAAILAAVMLIGMCACGENTDKPGETANNTVFGNEENGGATQPPANTDTSSLPNVSASDKFSGFDTTISYDRSKAVSVELKDGGSSANGAGVTVDGNTVTIRAGGTYILSGKLTDGQIVVSVEKTEKVQLVLENVEVTNSSSAAIYVTSADKVAITLTEGSTNKFTDGSTYSGQNEKGEPNACIFSKDDLTINGYGTLIVKGNYNNGISTTNDLKIVSGVIEVSAKTMLLRVRIVSL